MMAFPRRFCVMVRGENLLIGVEGQPTRLGFYSSRTVWARHVDEACRRAIRRVEEELATLPVLEKGEACVIEDVRQLSFWMRSGPSRGFTFFPAEEGEQDASAE